MSESKDLFTPYYATHPGLKAVFFVVSPELAISVHYTGQNTNFHEATTFAEDNKCFLPTEEQWLLGMTHPEIQSSGLYEWTTSEEDESRVLRGGSWYLNQNFTRAEHRRYFHPGDRNVSLGFRVCASPESLIRLS